MPEVQKPQSYYENQTRLHGDSTNLLDANILLHYTTHARINRQSRDKLMDEIMDKICKSLNNILNNHIRTHLPSADVCIKDCWNVVLGMPAPELRKLLKRICLDSLNDSQKVHAVLEFQ
jgi:hypothetical protein